jgi:hypothetical protein
MEKESIVPVAAPAPQRKMEFIKPPEGMLHIYTNNFSVGQTVFDLRLVFGELTDIDDKSIEVTQRVQVTMSWLEAKALAESLLVYVQNYEQQYGPIKTEFAPLNSPDLPAIPKITKTDK